MLNDNIIYNFKKLISLLTTCNKYIVDKKLKNINKYKIKSLKYSLSLISSLDYDLTIDNIDNLIDEPNIGKGTINRIKTIINNGSLNDELNELIGKMNDEPLFKFNDLIGQLTKLIGISEKKAIKLIEKYNIDSIESLKNIPNLNHSLTVALKYYNNFSVKIENSFMKLIYLFLYKHFSIIDKDLIFMMCGSFRRKKEFSSDIDILLVHENIYTLEDVIDSTYLTKVVKYLKNISFIIDDLTIDQKTKYMGFCKFNDKIMRVDIRFVGYESFIPALMYFTGSYQFNTFLRKKAKSLGYKLNEYGLFKSDKLIYINSEKELFSILNVQYLSPENRNF